MKLKLNHIGMIESADIELNGLTVIAGENDSGKSTVGKVLYSLIKSISQSNIQGSPDNVNNFRSDFNDYIENIFKNQLSEEGDIEFTYGDTTFKLKILNNRCETFHIPHEYENDNLSSFRPILIETPFIWSIFSTLKTINNLKARKNEIEFGLSPIVEDLYFALAQELIAKDSNITLDIKSIINGEFIEDGMGSYTFKKNQKNIELINTAMGIKYFGLLQVLANKNHFYKDQILILDEPEVHLHPKWQLELAKVIVSLVQKGVKVLVNSHSPYMIEALQRYSQSKRVSTNFYIAENGVILEDEQSLSKIFSKLSEPFDEFDKMDTERLNG